jgi:UDP-3-O-[3-hydroxymyristoyl] glucosamine N-acyltransferase
MVAGTFPRDLGHRVYAGRRLYGACWNAVGSHTVAYALLLAVPPFKRAVFRMFGYRGSCDFTIHPDTWIRDLPLLSIGEGVYLGNKATIAPNLCTPDGQIYVARVHIGRGTMVGHNAMIAPGVHIGANAVIGVGCAVNVDAVIGDDCTIGNLSGIDHRVRIGRGSVVGVSNMIAARATIGAGLRTPAHLRVLRRQQLVDQRSIDQLAIRQRIGTNVRARPSRGGDQHTYAD